MWLKFNGETVTMTMETSQYIDTYANFEADSGLSVPAIHIGYDYTYYEPNVRHEWATEEAADPQPMPWDEGDTILDNYDATVAARDARLAPDPLDVAKQEKNDNHSAGYSAAEGVPVTAGGFDFNASNGALTEINSINVAGLLGETLPAGFTWLDTSGVEHPADAAMMAALQKTVAIKHYQDAHKYAQLSKQVELATTVAEVEAVSDW